MRQAVQFGRLGKRTVAHRQFRTVTIGTERPANDNIPNRSQNFIDKRITGASCDLVGRLGS